MLHAHKETQTNVLGVSNLTHFGANCGSNSIPRNQTQVVKNQLTQKKQRIFKYIIQTKASKNCFLLALLALILLPYARHYNPRFVYSLPPFYIEEQFILQSIYGLKTEILHFLKPKIRGLYTRAVTDQERVIMARVRYMVCICCP